MSETLNRVNPPDSNADGVWVRMGGKKEYMVPSLTFKSLKALAPQIEKMGSLRTGSMPTGEQLDALTDLVLAAMKRNYPDMTAEKLEELIDMSNFIPLFSALMNVSGLTEKKPGEVAAVS